MLSRIELMQEIPWLILKHHKGFGNGSLNDKETMALIKGELHHIARNSYYKYKQELIASGHAYTMHG